jgi:DNA anti-recombination protein RmuC
MMEKSVSETSVENGNGIEQVRDLLFGTQVRQIEDRIQRQEQMVAQRLEAISSELKNATKALEGMINGRLSDIIAAQSETNGALEASIASLKEEMENRSRSSIEQLNRAERSLSEMIADSNGKLVEALSQQSEQSSRALSELESRLRKELAAKSALTKLFGDLSTAING